MELNSISANISTFQSMKPTKPLEPTPPPGGNIENRQPPSEPISPSETQKNRELSVKTESDNNINKNTNSKFFNADNLIDIYA